jgi:hypothetical protein
MWTTKVEQRKSGGYDIPLYRDDVLFAVIPLDEWWVMSATDFVADRALKAEGLNFKAADVKGERPKIKAMWTTALIPAGDSYDVHLLCKGEPAAVFSLNEWARLPATEWVVEDTLEAADDLAQYGDNIEEVDQYLRDNPDPL